MAITRLTLIANTVGSAGIPIISGDGRYLALSNSGGARSFIDPALKDKLGLLLVDLNAGTAQSLVLDPPPDQRWWSSSSGALGITSDGSKVLVSSLVSNLVEIPAGSPSAGLYLEDIGSKTFVPVGRHPNGFTHFLGYPASMSADGSHVVLSGSEWGADGAPVAQGVFELDTRTGGVARIAVSLEGSGTNGDPHATDVSISADGRFVVFDAPADRGLQLPAHHDLFVYDAVTGDTRSVNTSTDGTLGNEPSLAFSISGNGRYVVFTSASDNFVAGIPAGLGTSHVFVKDLQTGAIVLASADAYGKPGRYSLENWIAQGISNDGRYVVFASSDSFGFKELESSTKQHVFVKDMVTGAIALVNSTPETIDLSAFGIAISGDGSTIVFQGMKAVDGPSPHYEYLTYATPLPTFTPVVVNDILKGTAGADTLAGALGDDEYFVNDRRDIVVEYANQGRDTVHTIVDYTLPDNVEVLVLDGSAALNGTGNSLANTLIGNGAANSLYGGDGDDILEGGGGDDTYFVDSRGDVVVEHDGEGRDTIHTSVDYALPANVEVLVIEGAAAVSIVGNDQDNLLVGNAANNVLRGGAGDDVLEGGGGSDSLFGDAGNDTARFSGKLADYIITSGAIATVTARPGSATGGITSLTSIETLLFTDAAVTLVTDGVAAQAYRLYQAAFDRKPDLAGLGFWIAQMEKGVSLSSAAAQFVASSEFKTLFGVSPSNETFVDLLYQHVLHRAADKDGAAFWTGVLDRHVVTAADVLAQFSESPENQAALIGTITNGIAYQPYHG